jgi:formylglycine-generating enzyme required for sulfatase activity
MGSTDAEMAQGYALCKREIRSADCDRKGYLAQLHAEAEAHPVTISTFDLDRTEVTIGSYARCVSAGVCRSAALPEDRPLRADLPVTQVAASDAADYCRWAGGRLPTEAEWEYAARGGANRTFPWGDVYNPHLANHGSWADDPADATDGYAGLAPVGSFPDGATPLGLLDMAGNAAEWVADLVEIDPGTGTPLGYGKDAETDPAPHTVGGGPHIYRGGSYVDAATLLRSASRDYDPVLTRAAWVGFRCAATPS